MTDLSEKEHPDAVENGEDGGDDDIALPADTLAILQTFLREQADREQAIAVAEKEDAGVAPTFKAFEENWQLSQFWYNDRTKRILAGVCGQLMRPNETLHIALLSCPSLYDQIRAVNATGIVNLFEFDERFVAYGSDYVHFDYNLAANDDYLHEFNGLYDVIVVDPPFLAEECFQKFSYIVRRLCKPDTGKVILCSGQVVSDWAQRFMGLQRCVFHPEHERNLGNEFTSYANFDLDGFIEKVKDTE